MTGVMVFVASLTLRFSSLRVLQAMKAGGVMEPKTNAKL